MRNERVVVCNIFSDFSCLTFFGIWVIWFFTLCCNVFTAIGIGFLKQVHKLIMNSLVFLGLITAMQIKLSTASRSIAAAGKYSNCIVEISHLPTPVSPTSNLPTPAQKVVFHVLIKFPSTLLKMGRYSAFPLLACTGRGCYITPRGVIEYYLGAAGVRTSAILTSYTLQVCSYTPEISPLTFGTFWFSTATRPIQVSMH